jgi:glycosyltransferase involved in cell wall biosynthesis
MLAASDLLVWPANVSHFARPIIEAGAMARPVVASDFPSSRELVRPGETGLLVPPGDPVSLADAILRVLRNPDEERRMGEAGYRLARERYDARVNTEAIVSIYEKVLAGRLPARSAP